MTRLLTNLPHLTRALPIALCVPSLLFGACSSGGGGAAASGTNGSVIGRAVTENGANATAGGGGFGIRFEHEHGEAGRNEDVFAAEDLGEIATDAILVRGRVGDGADRRDCFRADVRGSGAVRVHAHFAAASGRIAAFRLRGGRAPAEAVALREGAEVAEIGASVRDGDHLVIVVEAAAATDYTLATGRNGADLSVAPMSPDAHVRAQRMLTNSAVVPGEMIVGFDGDAATAQRRIEQHGFELAATGGGVYRFRAIRGAALRPDAHGAVALADALFAVRRDVAGLAFVAPNHIVETARDPNDELYWKYRWAAPLTGLPRAWDVTTGDRVVIAVLDSGILKGHPDLEAAVSPHGFDMVSDPQNGDGDGIDPDPEDVLLSGNLFHGSHVAGIIGATADNEIGIAGVTWNAEIMAVRALGPRSGTIFDIIQAVRYAAGLPNASGRVPPEPAHIVNMSLTAQVDNPGLRQAIRDAAATGAILVAAAGNFAQDGNPVLYPAAYDEVIAVGSVGPTGERAGYSEIQPYVEIAAPGGDMSSRRQDGVISTIAFEDQGQWWYGWNFLDGTSMATPFVAGTIALMFSVDPGLTASDVRRIFRNTAVDRGAPGRDDEYGWGLIDVKAAVDAANGSGGSPPELRAERRAVTFGAAGRQTVALTSSGDPIEDLRILTSDLPRGVSAELSDTRTPAQLSVSVDAAAFAPAPARVTIAVGSASNPSTVEIEVAIETAGHGDDDLTVQLLSDDGSVLRAVGVSDGAFTLNDVPAGTYRLRAGLDVDGNGSFTDAGDLLSETIFVEVEPSIATNVGTIRAARRR